MTRPLPRQMLGFLAVGALAFVVDAGTLWLLMQTGCPAMLARVASIALAMVVAWYGNRTLSFRMTTPPTLREFTRYATLAGGVAVLNYVIFSALILLTETPPLPATALATLAAMTASFLGMKRGVFGK
ncbi:MAG: GtrA family protein [Pseudomonadaceae bacterium]|nr:GtrA family protein [Pseudomonadaceae bacterium]